MNWFGRVGFHFCPSPESVEVTPRRDVNRQPIEVSSHVHDECKFATERRELMIIPLLVFSDSVDSMAFAFTRTAGVSPGSPSSLRTLSRC